MLIYFICFVFFGFRLLAFLGTRFYVDRLLGSRGKCNLLRAVLFVIKIYSNHAK